MCIVCTLENPVSALYCDACDSDRPKPVVERRHAGGVLSSGLADPMDVQAAGKADDGIDSDVNSDRGVAPDDSDDDDVPASVDESMGDLPAVSRVPAGVPFPQLTADRGSSDGVDNGSGAVVTTPASELPTPRDAAQAAMEFEAVKVQYTDVATTLVRDNYIYYEVRAWTVRSSHPAVLVFGAVGRGVSWLPTRRPLPRQFARNFTGAGLAAE